MGDGDVLIHIGTKRHSGRYPWGSGEDPYQSASNLLAQIEEYRKLGWDRTQIAQAMDMKTSELDAQKTIALATKRAGDVSRAERLKELGMSNPAIGREMGIAESSVRALLDPGLKERSNAIFGTMKMLRDTVAEKRFVDVGSGIEQQLNVTPQRLKSAVILLKAEGYQIFYDSVRQQGTGEKTSLKVLAGPEEDWKDYFDNHRDKVRMVQSYTEDGGLTWTGIEPVKSVSRKRILVKYVEDAAAPDLVKDGVIELRRNVPDLSLGSARYAQVRIAVDGTHYMKGMAMYATDIPDGYDIIYNTNKKRGTPDGDVFKKIKHTKEDDPSSPLDEANPFGAVIRQKHYTDASGKEQLSPLNIVGSPKHPTSGEEGSWGEWSKSLSSQVLSKQTPALAKRQLNDALTSRKEEFEEIMSLTNPAVKQRLLMSFADGADAATVHLKAAAMPRQMSNVLLPFPTIKENEVFAPRFKDGETVVLIRHPHGGTFEIPQLTVNNRNKEALAVIGRDAKDAVGINPRVAGKLSGADFDGDTVLVIPNNDGAIRVREPLPGLKNFNPKERYPRYEGMPLMTPQIKAREMGDISNLITDMTIMGAKIPEIERAVRHSMVVIDAEKHKLNWRQSAIDNNIAQLKEEYQGGAKRGAATLISRASSTERVPERVPARFDPLTGDRLKVPGIDPRTGKKIWEKPRIPARFDPVTGEKLAKPGVDPRTGKRIYEESSGTYIKTWSYVKDPMTGKYLIDPATGQRMRKELKKPQVKQRLIKSTKMAEEEDAFNLSSGTRMEMFYAEHANALKSLANRARKAAVEIEDTPYSSTAREVYRKEVASLKAQLDLARFNRPFERQAQLIAEREVEARIRENPDMDDDHIKKIRGQALMAARDRVGAGKSLIKITDREWEAIQAGALSSSLVSEILMNTDLDDVRQRAMPRSTPILTPARALRARKMRDNGATIADIAELLGVSTTTVERVL